MDRRTFVKALTVGTGLALTASANDLVWGKSLSENNLADLPLWQLSKMIRNGEISSKSH